MKFGKIVEVEEKYLRSQTGSNERTRRERRATKSQKKYTAKPRNEQAINLRYTHMSEAVDAWESNIFDFVDFDSDYDDYDYDDYGYDNYEQNEEDRWNSRASNTYHPPTDARKQRACVICCEEVVDELTDPFEAAEVEFGYSFLDAILHPRERVPRDLSLMPARAKIGSETACCVPCIISSIAAALENDPSGRDIRCPRGCGSFSIAECQAFLLALPSTTPRVLSLVAKLDALLVRRVALENAEKGSSFVPCANADCNNEFLFLWPKSKCSLVTCNECDFDNCVVCRGPYHWGQTCQQMLAKQPSLEWRHENTRACPACFVSIEKNGGCSHHGCTRCGLQYNWDTAPRGIYGIAQMTTAIKMRRKIGFPIKQRYRAVKQRSLSVSVTYIASAGGMKPAHPSVFDVPQQPQQLPIWMQTIQI